MKNVAGYRSGTVALIRTADGALVIVLEKNSGVYNLQQLSFLSVTE